MNVLYYINMVRIIEYHFVSSHELFECTIRNNVEIWITNKGTQALCKFFFILHFPNNFFCITIHVKCLVFQRFSQETLVSITRVPKTQYQLIVRPHSHRVPCQVLISYFLSPLSSFGFLGIDVGVCNSSVLVPKFLNGKALFEAFVCFDFSFFKLWS